MSRSTIALEDSVQVSNINYFQIYYSKVSFERTGAQQYHAFVKEHLVERTKPITDVIKQNRLPLFGHPRKSVPSKEKQNMVSLKQNCSLFSQLHISCQVRQRNHDEFFAHENQSYPPSISCFGNLRSGQKTDLLRILEKGSASPTEATRVFEELLVDGAAIINILKPNGACKTFSDYASQVYLPYVRRQLQTVERIDLVWDKHESDSLKSTTRTKRGQGVRPRVEPGAKVPGDWNSFLRVDDNKTKLFKYLADQTIAIQDKGKEVLSASDCSVLTNSRENTGHISPCSHEEADTKLLLHAFDAGKEGYRKVMLRTVDTDAVVLAVAFFSRLDLEDLWIAFGAGKAFRYIAIHEFASSLRQEKFLTRLQGLTRHPRLLVGGRVLPGILGWHTKKPQMYSGP